MSQEQEQADADHDGAYRQLFEQPALVLDVVALIEPPLPEIAEAQIRPTRTTFLTENLHRKHSDCIWELPLAEHPEERVFLLVEFQSNVNHAMPMRVLDYSARLGLHLFFTRPEERDLEHPWPLVVPVVIYNGKRPWTAPTQLLAPRAASLCPGWAERQAQGAFGLWDLGHGALRAPEAAPDNLALLLFWMERVTLQRRPELVAPLFDRLLAALDRRGEALAVREAFLTFFHVILRLRGALLSSQRLENLNEVKHMLHNIVEVSVESGHQKGLMEGQRKGLTEAALALVKRKFGVNGEGWRARLEPMSAEELQEFLLRAAMAARVEEIEE